MSMMLAPNILASLKRYAIKTAALTDGASAYLSRTFTAGNRKTYTWAGWVQRNALGSLQVIWGVGDVATGDTFGGAYFDANDDLHFFDATGTADFHYVPDMAFRDTTAPYFLLFALDATNATAKSGSSMRMTILPPRN